MTKLSVVRQSNAAFAADRSQSSGLVCVFAGATSGIGASTLEVIASMLHDSTIYVLGRSAAKFAGQKERIAASSPSCRLEFIECDVSLLSHVDTACKQISPEKIDLLYMSQGLVPLNGAECKFLFPGVDVLASLPASKYLKLTLLSWVRHLGRPRNLFRTLVLLPHPASHKPAPALEEIASASRLERAQWG